MSQTFSLVCHETKQAIWIGQGLGVMRSLYYGDDHTMENLRRFLNQHKGQALYFVCDDVQSDEVAGYRNWEDLATDEHQCDHGNRDGDGDCLDCGSTCDQIIAAGG